MMDIISLKIDNELKRELMEIAAKKDRTVSQIMRGLIRVYVDSQQEPTKLTVKVMQSTDQGEENYHVIDAIELFKHIDL